MRGLLPRRREFAQPLTDHVLHDADGDPAAAVVHVDGLADPVGQNHGAARPTPHVVRKLLQRVGERPLPNRARQRDE